MEQQLQHITRGPAQPQSVDRAAQSQPHLRVVTHNVELLWSKQTISKTSQDIFLKEWRDLQMLKEEHPARAVQYPAQKLGLYDVMPLVV